MAKWTYFNPDHWNYLFPPLSHKDLRIIEDVLASHNQSAKLLENALQGIYPKTTILTVDLYEARPTKDTVAISISRVKPDTDDELLQGNTLIMYIKWGFENNIEASFATGISYLLKNSEDIRNGYQVYEHLLQDEKGQWRAYCGITKRTWKTRWQEHLAAAKRGSNYLFHKAIRELLPKKLSEVHQVAAAGLTEEDAMYHEEWFVERHTLYPDNPFGLNMIPGGYAGLRALHKLGVTSLDHHISPEDRDMVIEQFLKDHPRKGVPNPLIAAKWRDESYAESIICGPEGRLNPNQVREIRRLSSKGLDVESISAKVEAKNLAQIRRVLEGKTYSRIH